MLVILHMSGKVAAVIIDLLNIIISGILKLYHNLLTKIFKVLPNPLLFLYGSLSINLAICVFMFKIKSNNFLVYFCKIFKVVSIINNGKHLSIFC